MRTTRVCLGLVVTTGLLLAVGPSPSALAQAATPVRSLQVGNAHVAPTVPRAAQLGIGHVAGGLSADTSANATYHGGPVLHAPTAYAVFWLPADRHFEWNGTPAGDASYQNIITSFLQKLGGRFSSSLWKLVTQYTDASGPVSSGGFAFGGSSLDTTNYPHDPLQDGDVQQAVVRAMAKQGWSAGLGSVFFVYTAYGARTCLPDGSCALDVPSGWCAYHSFFSSSGTTAVYSSVPSVMIGANGPCTFFTSSPNSDLWADTAVDLTSHELLEAVTNPTANAWSDAGGQEIGDKCVGSFGPVLDRDGADVLLGPAPVGSFMVQAEWSNRSGGCALQLPPTVISIAPATGPSTGGTVVQVVGTGLRSVPNGSRLTFVPSSPGAVGGPGVNVGCISQTSDADVCTVSAPPGSGVVDVLATVQLLSSSPVAADQFTYRLPCTSISVDAASGGVPQPVGTSIRLMLTMVAPANCFLQAYEFLVTPPGGPQTVLQDDTTGIADWDTTGLAPGVYQITLLGFPDTQNRSSFITASTAVTLTAATSAGSGGGGGGTGGGGGRPCSPCRQQ